MSSARCCAPCRGRSKPSTWAHYPPPEDLPVSAHQGAEPGLTVAAVLRVGLPEYARTHRLPPQHWRALRAIQACRTPALGGHLYQCSQCEEPRTDYTDTDD